jgi:hypothetical protein
LIKLTDNKETICLFVVIYWKMAKTANISNGVTSVGYKNSRGYNFMPQRQNSPKNDSVKLRIGEVLKGTILDVYQNAEALVRIPLGTFRCELHNNLKSGDELFFKVIDNYPSLFLKVHSISVKKNGKELPAIEILRMLDLPDNELYKSLIDFLKTQKHLILRDEALLIMRYYSQLSQNDLNNKSMTEIFRTLFWLNDSQFEINSALFRKLYPLFRDGDFTKNTLIKLYADLSGTSDQEKMRSLLRQINPKISFAKFLTYFSKESTFYNWLNDLVDTGFAPKSAKDMLEIINSMHFWNENSFSLNHSFHLIVPIPFAKNFITFRLVLMNCRSNESKDKRTFINEKDPGMILASSHLISAIELHDCVEYDELINDLKKMSEDLNLIAKYNNFSIQALIIQDEEGIEQDILPSKPISASMNFSIVV